MNRSGRREQMEQLIAHYYSRIYRFCARRVGTEAAEDVTQEVFYQAFKSLSEFRSNSLPSTWIYGIAQNCCKKAARSTVGMPQLQYSFKNEFSESFENSVVDANALYKALGQLSKEHLEIVELHEIEGLTYAEISEFLGIPEGTVKSRLHYAFQRLRETMSIGGMG